jgi:hypothetical protein
MDGAEVDLGGVADTRRVQGQVELAEGLGGQLALGVAEVDLGVSLERLSGPSTLAGPWNAARAATWPGWAAAVRVASRPPEQ